MCRTMRTVLVFALGVMASASCKTKTEETKTEATKTPEPTPPPAAATPVPKPATAVDLLPTGQVLPADEIHEHFVDARIKPFDDPTLYFEITVPKDWEGRKIEVANPKDNQNRTVPLARITPNDDPAGAKATIEVQYIHPPAGVTAERFMDVFASQAAMTFVQRQHTTFGQRPVEDALLQSESKDFGTMYTRVTALKRDELVFIVACSATKAKYADYQRIFAVAAQSFDPSGKPPTR